MGKHKHNHSPRDTRPHVVISVFTEQERRGWVHPSLTSALASAFLKYGHMYMFTYMPIHAIHPVTSARNRAVKEAEEIAMITGRPVEWLSMWDNDIAPSPDVWDVLGTAPPEADIVILPYYVWLDSFPVPAIGDWIDGQMKTPAPGTMKEGWNEIGVGGTGAMFIRGRVLNDPRLTRPLFKIKYDDYKAQAVSEDIYFTGMCKDAGLRIFTNTDYVCGHHRTVDLAEFNASLAKLMQKQREEHERETATKN